MNIDKTLSLSYLFTIDGQNVAYFNGIVHLNEDLDYQVNNSVNNQKIYRENRDAVNEAYTQFEDEVYKIVDKIEGGSYEIN